jgi:hypothetical protein
MMNDDIAASAKATKPSTATTVLTIEQSDMASYMQEDNMTAASKCGKTSIQIQ